MVLNNYRKEADIILLPLARRLKGVNPNIISALSLIFAFLAALFFYLSPYYVYDSIIYGDYPTPYFLAIGALMVALNALFDALDGKIARITGRATQVGDFLDHVIDRLSDVLIVGALAFTTFVDTTLGLITVVSMLIASYMGTQAQALGCGRNYHGIMGRAERMLLLIVFPLAQIFLYTENMKGYIPGTHLTFIDILMYIILIGSAFTALQRGVETFRELRERDKKS
ncbi:MAG: CDP-alcohol phosphatidyltransferase family protein [Thermoplasmata archaeon]|nr:CDP-alcohol phosphatidyltransferase family protein [Thermoplasmata archaeon]